MRRYKFLGLVAERDAKLVQEVGDRKLSLEHEQAVLTETLADIAAARNMKLEENTKLEGGKKTRVSMLSRIRNEKSKHAQAIEELKKSQEKLKNLIDEMERRRLADEVVGQVDGEFAKLKGKLIRPVSGKVTKKFGKDRHPKFGTVTFNNGINIKAKAGSPIRAVAGGKVEFVDWISGYGNCIIINHGGGYYTLYAHAEAIFVASGQQVAGREVIAEVGDTGSLNGYECHFEIRQGKEPVDPSAWFAK
jgi:murein DD-endopeptidase MepM/ murein hydrolase activator NlpD